VAVGLIVLAGGVLGVARLGGDHRPALHRSARPAWCPWLNLPSPIGGGRPPRIDRFDAREIVGLELADAKRLAARDDCTVRVVNGGAMLTMDLGTSRINVDVEDGIVTGLDPRAGGPIG
jgi:hypothetical protein